MIDTSDIPTPTKESDAQYVYIFDYWAFSDGTKVNFDTFRVSAPVEIYAHYSTVTREYTVRWISYGNLEYDNVESHLLAENLVLDGSTYYDTGIAPMSKDRDWTIAIDCTFDKFDDSQYNLSPLVSCYNGNGSNGFEILNVVATSGDLGKEFRKRNGAVILVTATEEDAQYILIGGEWYHDMWFRPENIAGTYPTVTIVQINEEEYNVLYDAVEKNEEIQTTPSDSEIAEDSEETPLSEDTTTLEFVIKSKLNEMNAKCSTIIKNGFDIVLSDGISHHFSLTEQDQLNLITLSTMLSSGETAIPYHADGEPCKFYPVEDITAILNAATSWKTYHITYNNSLKTYINSLDDIATISAITYGIEIPVEYQSDVMRVLLMQQ